MQRLILTEKPSVAAEFARALNATRRTGYFESPDTIITYCVGHLLRLLTPEEYDPAYKHWSVEKLPIVPKQYQYAEIPEFKKQLATVKLLVKQNPAQIVIATDAGREGELIARETLKWCGKSDLSNVYRFWTSEALTPEVIQKNLRTLTLAGSYTHLYNSGYYRQIADWLVGMNFTRYFSCKLNNDFSFGRVQVPVLSAIVGRTEQIKSFTPQPFFNLRVTLRKDITPFSAFYIKDNSISFKERADLVPLLTELENLHPHAKVLKIQSEHKLENPLQLYNLTALQKAANGYYGYRAEQTANIAQALYEKHTILSYPRTSSRVLARSNFDLFCQTITQLHFHYDDIFRGCKLPTLDNTHIFNDEKLSDHHALIILDKLPDSLSEEERNVAMLVLRNMAGILLPPFIADHKTIDFDICGKSYQWKGTQVLSLGWKQLYSSLKPKDEQADEDEPQDQDDKTLPALAQGDILNTFDPQILEKKTKPPAPFTEASLLTFMENNGLGTEATRADIIERLLIREYTLRSKRSISATDKGIFLIHTIHTLPAQRVKNFIGVEETAKWEALLDSSPETFYNSIKISVQEAIESLRNLELPEYQKTPIGVCPHCGCPVRDFESSYRCDSQNGCPFSLPKKIAGHVFTEKELAKLIALEETHLIGNFKSQKTGNSFKARLRYDPSAKKLDFLYPDPAVSSHTGGKT